MSLVRFVVLLTAGLLFIGECSAQVADATQFRLLQEQHKNLVASEAMYAGALAVLVSKTSATTARADLLIYDRHSSLSVEMQPVRFANGKFDNDGEATRVKWNRVAGDGAYYSDQSVVFSVGKDSNAVLIRLYREGDDPSENTSIIVANGTTPSLTKVKFRIPQSSGLGVVPDFTKIKFTKCEPTANGENSFNCGCPLVELENSTCGHRCKYCGGYIGNVIDGINCIISCGSPCTSRDCNELDCLGPNT